MEKLLEEIACKHLDIPTLETRNSDSLDFYDVSVWGVKSALTETYNIALAIGKMITRKPSWNKAPEWAKFNGITISNDKKLSWCWSTSDKGFLWSEPRPNNY